MIRSRRRVAQPDISDRRGFTLTEMVIVLSIIGTMLGGIWLGVGAVNTHVKVTKALQELRVITQNIRTMNSGRSSFAATTAGNDITAAMMSSGVFPAEMTLSGQSHPLNPWGGFVAIYVMPNSPNATNAQFEVMFYSTPAILATTDNHIPCANLLSKTVGLSQDAGLLYVYDAGDNAWQSTAAALDTTNFPACKGQVAWTFKL